MKAFASVLSPVETGEALCPFKFSSSSVEHETLKFSSSYFKINKQKYTSEISGKTAFDPVDSKYDHCNVELYSGVLESTCGSWATLPGSADLDQSLAGSPRLGQVRHHCSRPCIQASSQPPPLSSDHCTISVIPLSPHCPPGHPSWFCSVPLGGGGW